MKEKDAVIEEVDPKKVVDVASFGNADVKQDAEPEMVIPEPIMGKDLESISKDDFNKISSIRTAIEQVHVAIGSIELQKSKMVAQALSLRNDMEEVAKSGLENAGILKDKMEEYRVDIKTGRIVATKDLPQR